MISCQVYLSFPHLVSQSHFVDLQDRINVLQKAQDEVDTSGHMLVEKVGVEQIATVVSRWTGIPVNKLGQTEKDRYLHLAEHMKQRVIGQDPAGTDTRQFYQIHLAYNCSPRCC